MTEGFAGTPPRPPRALPAQIGEYPRAAMSAHLLGPDLLLHACWGFQFAARCLRPVAMGLADGIAAKLWWRI